MRASMKGANCSLSGVENKCRELMKKGAPKEEIAATCMAYVIAASDAMCKALIETFGDLPVVFSGWRVLKLHAARAHERKVRRTVCGAALFGG